jgi:hypothetical protein
MNYKSVAYFCLGIKHKFWGDFPDIKGRRYFKVPDFIFLTFCGMAYASHIAKIEKLADVPLDSFSDRLMRKGNDLMIELMILEEKVTAYAYVEGRYRAIE